MKQVLTLIFTTILFMITSCNYPNTSLHNDKADMKILFLHHSTGRNVWLGNTKQDGLLGLKKHLSFVPKLIEEYNDTSGKKLRIEERNFPSGKPYPWANYPYDYYNIWVKNAGEKPYLGEPTLEMLTKEYKVIIFKHCFPVSHIEPDDQNPDINSPKKTIANYKLQYLALRTKLYQFPETKFILWTGPALVKSQTNEQEALRANEFFKWVKEEWDLPGDNIEIFDFRELETEGSLFIKEKYAVNSDDSHPNEVISVKTAKLFVDKIIETALESVQK